MRHDCAGISHCIIEADYTLRWSAAHIISNVRKGTPSPITTRRKCMIGHNETCRRFPAQARLCNDDARGVSACVKDACPEVCSEHFLRPLRPSSVSAAHCRLLSRRTINFQQQYFHTKASKLWLTTMRTHTIVERARYQQTIPAFKLSPPINCRRKPADWIGGQPRASLLLAIGGHAGPTTTARSVLTIYTATLDLSHRPLRRLAELWRDTPSSDQKCTPSVVKGKLLWLVVCTILY
jgi:hypothetical protein